MSVFSQEKVLNKIIYFLLSTLLLFLFFSPTLQEFLFSDDIFNFFHRNSLVKANPDVSLIDVSLNSNNTWMHIHGRFSPLAFFTMDSVFLNTPSVTTYRWVILFTNFATIPLVLWYLRLLGAKINLVIWCVCLCAVMQFRVQYHDSYTSFNGMYQILTIFIFTSLAFYVLYIKHGKWYYIIPSLFFYATALLQTEAGLAAFFFIPATAFVMRNSVKTTIKQFLPYLSITLIYLAFVAGLKENVLDKEHIYIGLQSNFDMLQMARLWCRQVYACLPLSNLHRQISIPNILYHRFTLLPILTILIFILSYGLQFFAGKQNNPISSAFNWRLILFSILLMTVPCLTIMPSLKYQQEVQMGIAYLPVYIQNIGTATLLACILSYCYQQKKKTAYILSIVISVCIVTTFLFNSALINAQICESSNGRVAQYKAVTEGILNDVEAGDVIYVNESAWFYNEIFANWYSRNFTLIDTINFKTTTDTTKTYYWLETTNQCPIQTTLYKLNPATKEHNQIVAKKIYNCTQQKTEADRRMLDRWKEIAY